MKKTSLIKFVLVFFTTYPSLLIKPIYSSATILECSSIIPDKVACLITASSYKIKIERIDVCTNNPFPKFRSTPEYAAANCINLFDKNISSPLNIYNDTKFEITKDSEFEGTYKYISMIFVNKFSVSGKFSDNNYVWYTSKKGPKVLTRRDDNRGVPMPFTTKLKNWRGDKDLDNKYCENNGGTKSRCELNYNGLKITAIGIDSNLVETSGSNIKKIFYFSELGNSITINKKSEGYFDIKYKKNLEVYGNGKEVKSISIAPFMFKANFINSKLK